MPKIVDHEQYRKELLNKSFELFAEKGYATVTMRQIAQGLEVSTGTLYHYFSSKEALFEQLLEELTQRDLSRVTTQIGDAATLSERIEVAFQLLDQHRDYLFKQALLVADFHQHQQREGKEFSHVFRRICQGVEKISVEFLGIRDPQLVTFILSFVDGLIWQEVYGGASSVDYSTQAKLLSKMLTPFIEQQKQQPQET